MGARLSALGVRPMGSFDGVPKRLQAESRQPNADSLGFTSPDHPISPWFIIKVKVYFQLQLGCVFWLV